MDLSSILSELSNINYDIEFQENLIFAKNTLGMDHKEAKVFAKGSALEDRDIDKNLLKLKKEKELKDRIKLYTKKYKKYIKLQDKLNQLSNLIDNINL